jgi:MFS family permease
MNKQSRRIVTIYVTLTLLSTFASSFIWGINTLFLLNAGLSVTGAFLANAFFTAGQVIFEIPTGIVADTRGRRVSYLLGAATLFVSTLAYYWLWEIKGPLWTWAIVSIFLGLGFTFFSGATEAWLVDGLRSAGYKDDLDSVFAKGSIAQGFAMLTGTLAGGFVAQITNLGVPYLMRVAALGLTFLLAFIFMKDEGFKPKARTSVVKGVRSVFVDAVKFGFRKAPVRWMMLSGIFTGGIGIFAFYAMQPHLLNLYGKSDSYAIAGLSATIVAGAQILGGVLVPYAGRVFAKRTDFFIFGTVLGVIALALIGLLGNFYLVLAVFAIWSVIWSANIPIRQSYINELLPSEQRATILSTDNMLASAGGVVSQPILGKTADVYGYPASYIGSAIFQFLALPFVILARREKAESDKFGKKPSSSKPPGS